MAPGPNTVKIDPSTQIEYTFAAFTDSCSKLFSAMAHERFKVRAIKAYWDEECRAIGGEGIDQATGLQTRSKPLEELGAEAEDNQENSNSANANDPNNLNNPNSTGTAVKQVLNSAIMLDLARLLGESSTLASLCTDSHQGLQFHASVVLCCKSRSTRRALTAPAELSKHEWLHHVMSGGSCPAKPYPPLSLPGVVRREEAEEATCNSPSLPLSPIRVSSCRNVLSKTSRVHNGDLLFVHVPLDMSNPFQRNIQLCGEATIDWIIEHGIEVKVRQTAMHVAMVVAGSRSVVEAVPGDGVRVQTLVDFFSSYEKKGASFFHGEIQGVSDEQKEQAVQISLEKLGAGYADGFLPWTDAGQYYCSSLVDHAYQHALGEEQVFFEHTYHLQFEPREYWNDYYRELGKPMPRGASTNPTLLMHSPRLHYSELLIGNKHKEPLFLCLDEDDDVLGFC